MGSTGCGQLKGTPSEFRMPLSTQALPRPLFLPLSQPLHHAAAPHYQPIDAAAWPAPLRPSTAPAPRPAPQIMGRSENDDLSASQVFYPCMQAADIFFLKVRAACHAVAPASQPARCAAQADLALPHCLR